MSRSAGQVDCLEAELAPYSGVQLEIVGEHSIHCLAKKTIHIYPDGVSPHCTSGSSIYHRLPRRIRQSCCQASTRPLGCICFRFSCSTGRVRLCRRRAHVVCHAQKVLVWHLFDIRVVGIVKNELRWIAITRAACDIDGACIVVFFDRCELLRHCGVS